MRISWAFLALALVAAPARGAGPEANIGKTYVTLGAPNKRTRQIQLMDYKCPYRSPYYNEYINQEFVVTAYSAASGRYTIEFVESGLECTVGAGGGESRVPPNSALVSASAGPGAAGNVGETFITTIQSTVKYQYSHFANYKCPYRTPAYEDVADQTFVVSEYLAEIASYRVEFESGYECTVTVGAAAPFWPARGLKASVVEGVRTELVGKTVKFLHARQVATEEGEPLIVKPGEKATVLRVAAEGDDIEPLRVYLRLDDGSEAYFNVPIDSRGRKAYFE